jgi:UDP-2,4-diacetamido-2,4,6-trideoxy-beta-L-altropyranose hydrolase
MNVIIRADASRVIGSGHVMRTMTLGRALRQAGAKVSFVTRLHEGGLIDQVRADGFGVTTLAAPERAGQAHAEPAHASWVGASWQDDARDTSAGIRDIGAPSDWLIADHYGLDARWEAALRPSAKRILVIDDLADRHHECDLLLDQNLVDGLESRYTGKVREDCGMLLGPRYALLQPLYEELHEQLLPRRGPIRRVFIYFGGADRRNFTALALRAFLNLNRPDVAVDVVLATDAPTVEAIRTCARRHPNVHLYRQLPSLAPLMARADVAVGAAGSTSWERMCLGLPALVVTLAENQKAVAAALHRRGIVTWVGHHDEVGLAELQQALSRQLERGADTESSRAGHAAVDGKGLRRVRAALLLDLGAAVPLVLRSATSEDEALLLEWANDALTRRNSFARALISAEDHHRWFCARLHETDRCLLLVAETRDGVPLGMTRFDWSATGWRINYSIASPYRGKGLGRRMLEQALTSLAASRDVTWVLGRVMATNAASHRVFRALGFESVSEADGGVEYKRGL